MKRLAFIIGGVSLFAWGMSGALAGCGGDDGTAPIDSDGGGASTSSGGSSGAASSSGATSSSGGTGDGGGGGDGGGDGGGTGDGGGGASNPGKITCGAAECTADTQICCRTFGDAGCIASNANCQGAEIECDEKADCQGAEICCRNAQGRQRCGNAGNCDGFGEAIVCKANTECSDGGTCKEWSCANGQVKIRSCTQPFQGCQ